MPESTIPSTELTSQYSAQVASDLETNAKEQARVGAELAGLQEQLLTLQRDHTILVNMQKALGAAGDGAAPSSENAPAPTARYKTPVKSTTGEGNRAKKAGTEQASKRPKKTAAAKTAGPTLVELIRGHLTGQNEPRSAAEITTALGQAHPDRTIKTTVVRTTLEGLVAKSQAERTKQGSSVFYTATATQPEPTTAAQSGR